MGRYRSETVKPANYSSSPGPLAPHRPKDRASMPLGLDAMTFRAGKRDKDGIPRTLFHPIATEGLVTFGAADLGAAIAPGFPDKCHGTLLITFLGELGKLFASVD